MLWGLLRGVGWGGVGGGILTNSASKAIASSEGRTEVAMEELYRVFVLGGGCFGRRELLIVFGGILAGGRCFEGGV